MSSLSLNVKVHAERDLFNEMGGANNMVMQEKLDKMTAENAQMKQKMAANQAVAAKYHHVINRAMFLTKAIEETDDTTVQTQ